MSCIGCSIWGWNSQTVHLISLENLPSSQSLGKAFLLSHSLPAQHLHVGLRVTQFSSQCKLDVGLILSFGKLFPGQRLMLDSLVFSFSYSIGELLTLTLEHSSGFGVCLCCILVWQTWPRFLALLSLSFSVNWTYIIRLPGLKDYCEDQTITEN